MRTSVCAPSPAASGPVPRIVLSGLWLGVLATLIATACGSEEGSSDGTGGTSAGGGSMGGESMGGTSSTAACEADDWDDDDDPNTACVARTICPAGQHVASEGGPTADRTCESCAMSTFSAAENSRACTPWTTCGDDEIETGAGTATSDRACASRYWLRQFGSSAADYGVSVAVDDEGNVYVTGHTLGALPNQTSVGGRDAYLRKYDSTGKALWTRQFGSSSDDFGRSVGVDGGGNVYVAGYTDAVLPGKTSAGAKDAFVRKYDPAGTEIWTRQFGSNGDDYAYTMSVSQSGDVYIAGQTAGALPSQSLLGAVDAYVSKYDSAGTEIWTRQFGTNDHDHGVSVAVDASGNVYVVGRTLGTFDDHTNAGSWDAFLRKYDSTGADLWTHQFGSSDTDFGTSVSVDANGNAFVAGYTAGTLPGQTSAGEADLYLLKVDATGDQLWARQFGTSGYDTGTSVTVDEDGNALVAGSVVGALPGQTSAGLEDAVVLAYDSAGAELWTRQLGSSGNDDVNCVRVDDGAVYVAGTAGGALPEQTHALGFDVFVAKWAR